MEPHESLPVKTAVATIVPDVPVCSDSVQPPVLALFWRILIFFVGFGVLNVGISIGVVLAMLLWGFVTDSSGSPDQAMDRLTEKVSSDEFSDNVVLLVLVSPPMTLAVFIWCCVCRKFLDRRKISTMGLVKLPRPLSSLVLGLVLGGLPIVVATAAIVCLGGFQYQGLGGSVVTLLLVPTLVVAAFMEEIMFRGYLLQNFLDRQKPLWGIAITSIFFWLLHSLNPHVWTSPVICINMIGAGVILAQAYLLTQDIWFPTAVHFAWNCLQGVVFGLPISGIDCDGFVQLIPAASGALWLTGGDFGLEGSVIVTITEITMIFLFAAILRRRAPQCTQQYLLPREDSKLVDQGLG